jgi:hypothetical protein
MRSVPAPLSSPSPCTRPTEGEVSPWATPSGGSLRAPHASAVSLALDLAVGVSSLAASVCTSTRVAVLPVWAP